MGPLKPPEPSSPSERHERALRVVPTRPPEERIANSLERIDLNLERIVKLLQALTARR